MRIFIFIAILFPSLFLVQCHTQKKVAYNVDMDALKKVNPELEAQINEGMLLYKKNCTSCHGIFTDGKKGIPNFSKEQLDGYRANFVKKDKKNHAFAKDMTQLDIDKILLFLSLRKRD